MIGPKISKYISSAKDISDGFIGDLKKMLNYNYGASLNIDKLPITNYMDKILKSKLINKKFLLNSGDDYELIIISPKKNRDKISHIAKSNNVKISLVGKTTKKIEIVDDSNKTLNIPKEFDHFL